MGIINIHHGIIEELYGAYKVRGYVTEDNVLDAIVANNLQLDEVEYVCEYLISMGVIIRNDATTDSDDNEDIYDRSQIDYEKLFRDIIDNDENLTQFINELRQIQPPQHREMQNLILQAKNNNHYAKNRIVEMYLRTVVRIAFWHHKKYQIPLAEAIQDGCMGLVIALNKYEVGRQDKFSTYSPWWIRQYIIRQTSTLNPLVYIPINLKDKLFGIYDILEHHYCNQCDSGKVCLEIVEEVSEKLICNQAEAEVYVNYLNTFESIEELMEKDECIFVDDGATEEQIFIDYNREELKNTIAQMLKMLNSREKQVIMLRFGFNDGEKSTLEEIGNKFGLTRERIRQIEKKAFKKLRHPSRSKKLRWFLD